MGLFDFLKKSKEENKSISRTINGISVDQLPDHVYESKFPWRNDKVGGTTLTVGNTVMLWWLDKYHGTKRRVPDYFEKNYIDSFTMEMKKLVSEEWIKPDGSLTSKGKKFLNDNFYIIEKHRSHWMSDKDHESFKIARSHEKTEHNKWLRTVGLTEMAERNEKNQFEDKEQDKLRERFDYAEKLSKENQIELSTKILNTLIEDNFSQTAPLYERLAKNYRKQKNYEKEIEICQLFLKNEQPKYGGNQWIDVFQKRIKFAESKL